jgi:hypothetical protein
MDLVENQKNEEAWDRLEADTHAEVTTEYVQRFTETIKSFKRIPEM